jgi:serine/threonine protein kinase
MTTGRQAFGGTTTAVIFEAVLNRAPNLASHINPDAPLELDRILSKALEKDREVRYQHASDLRADLKRLKRATESGSSATVDAADPTQRSQLAGFLASRMLWAALSVLGIVLIAAITYLLTPPVRLPKVTGYTRYFSGSFSAVLGSRASDRPSAITCTPPRCPSISPWSRAKMSPGIPSSRARRQWSSGCPAPLALLRTG